MLGLCFEHACHIREITSGQESLSWCICLSHCSKHLNPMYGLVWNPYTLTDRTHELLAFMDVCQWLSSGSADKVGLFLNFSGEPRSTPLMYVSSSHSWNRRALIPPQEMPLDKPLSWSFLQITQSGGLITQPRLECAHILTQGKSVSRPPSHTKHSHF